MTDTPINTPTERRTIWQQFVDNKETFIGKTLRDEDITTKIIDVILEHQELGDQTIFSVIGEDFTCSVNVAFAGIGSSQPGLLSFGTAYGTYYIEE